MTAQLQLCIGGMDAAIAELHYTKRHFLYLATRDGLRFKQKGLRVSDAIRSASDYINKPDAYCSVNSFRTSYSRKAENISEINSFFVDLDYYNTEYKSLSAVDLWALIKKENPYIPYPSSIENSGKGAYLFWILDRPISHTEKSKQYDLIGQWKTYMQIIAKCLKKYGADSACADFSRVLRLPETINTKTGSSAVYYQSGLRYSLADFKKAWASSFPELTSKPKRKKVLTKNGVRYINSWSYWYGLAFARISDLKSLIDKRGGKLTDYRKRMLFAYAVELGHLVTSRSEYESSLRSFCDDYFMDSQKYNDLKYIQNIIDQWQQHQDQDRNNWNLDVIRYRLRSQTLVDMLDVTDLECRGFKGFITRGERLRRKRFNETIRRRKLGATERSVYLEKMKADRTLRVEQINKLIDQGYSVSTIAKIIGMSKGRVRKLKNGRA